MPERIREVFHEHAELVRAVTGDREIITLLERSSIAIAEAFCEGGTLFTFGNGGSAADAQHMAAEMVGRFKLERDGYPAIALTANSSIATSLANDFGFDNLFARQLTALGAEGDVAVVFSTSGTSKNIIRGIETSLDMNMHVIGLTGGNGGLMAGLCHETIIVPSDDTPRIQEIHGIMYHIMCELVELAVCKREAGE